MIGMDSTGKRKKPINYGNKIHKMEKTGQCSA